MSYAYFKPFKEWRGKLPKRPEGGQHGAWYLGFRDEFGKSVQ
jgi:hypothetical protein